MDGQPPTSVTSSRRPALAGRVVRRLLLVAAVVCVTLGATLLLLPTATTRRPAVVHPAPAHGAPASGALALAAVRGGVPAALPDLTALIGQRETYLRVHPKDGAAWAVLGAAYVERGRRTAQVAYYPRAEQALRTSLSTLPKNNAEALDGLAALANARRDFPAARKWGETALKQAPKRWTTYPLLIDAYTGLGDYKKARGTLDKLMALHKGRPVTLARAAAVYRDRGWREDAAATLTEAAAGAGTPVEQAAYQEQAGQLAWERGDTAEALRRFGEAVRLDPDQWAARAGQGRVLAALGRTAEAEAAYRAALARQPLPQYALELGELYESVGLADKAREQYDLLRARVGAAAAGGVDEELVLGRFEADHGDPESAVRRLRAEWRRQPGIAVADALGWALHRTGEDEEALKFAGIATDKAHGGGVRSALYAYHRGVIEQHLDRPGSARRNLQDALRINPDFSLLGAPAARAALAKLGEPDASLPPDVKGPESKR
ncbi:tetratricopeptide repeat protein [Streptomyces adustus]|uniref:tetratricopeptide repeat protein n=1 Tax=Streptomyces adustus TaxID=1609272 RepID=UPI00371BFDC5